LQVIPQINPLIPLEIPVPDALIALAATVLIRIVVNIKGKNAKKYRKDVEYGSARWGNKSDVKLFCVF
jgi:type IV secretion system protein VirD4